MTDRRARCWGANPFTSVSSSPPIVVPDEAGTGELAGVTGLGLGGVSCALLEDGTARCWGRNLEGEQGDGTTERGDLPGALLNEAGDAPLANITQLTLGVSNGCALLKDGTARCWGLNQLGQLGDGSNESTLLPVVVLNETGDGPLSNIVQLASGQRFNCALLAGGTARCWGQNAHGSLGTGTVSHHETLPTPILDE